MALPARLFCDTSFFYACFDRHDVNHERAQQLSEEAATVGSALYVTWDIISETLTLLRYRRTYREALIFLTEVKPHLRLVNYGDTVRSEAEQIFRRYGRDRKLSFCDAISFVVVTTLLDDMPSLAFDTDFRALGLTVIPQSAEAASDVFKMIIQQLKEQASLNSDCSLGLDRYNQVIKRQKIV